MRPKAEALGYLFVAGLEEEQRQERETTGSFPFGKLRVGMTARKATATAKATAKANLLAYGIHCRHHRTDDFYDFLKKKYHLSVFFSSHLLHSWRCRSESPIPPKEVPG
jgi:hypothetical protein